MLDFEYVPDIVERDAFRGIFEQSRNKFDYILHTASPVNFAVTDIEKELINPAVQG